jgi:hypothetical protein
MAKKSKRPSIGEIRINYKNLTTSEKAEYKTQRRLGIDKNQKWANTPTEKLKLLQKIFKDFLQLNMLHDSEDTKDLMEIFNMDISETNIHNYIHRPCNELYMGLVNDKLIEVNNQTDKILI